MDGYSGKYCDVEINECENVTCNSQGFCLDQVATFICVCNAGFSGMWVRNLTGIIRM